MEAERNRMSWIHRSRRAAIEHDIVQQRAAIERWSAQADEAARTAPLQPPEPDVEVSDPVDRHRTRTAMLDPSKRLSELLGDRPTGLAAREAWMREAALLVARDAPLELASAMEPSMDDLGPEL